MVIALQHMVQGAEQGVVRNYPFTHKTALLPQRQTLEEKEKEAGSAREGRDQGR